jgi:uncharacterized protein (DUF2141 family)
MGLFVARLFVKHNPLDKIIAKTKQQHLKFPLTLPLSPLGRGKVEERSKGMHLKKIIIVVFILLLGLLQIPGLGQEKRFNVKGEISFTKKSAVMISLLTKEEFESNKDPQFKSIIEVGPKDLEKGKISFSFTNVPEGMYGIRCFQDLNGNKILDRGDFGPVEPWGIYRLSRPAFRGPTFEEIAFKVDQDIADIEIELR